MREFGPNADPAAFDALRRMLRTDSHPEDVLEIMRLRDVRSYLLPSDVTRWRRFSVSRFAPLVGDSTHLRLVLCVAENKHRAHAVLDAWEYRSFRLIAWLRFE